MSPRFGLDLMLACVFLNGIAVGMNVMVGNWLLATLAAATGAFCATYAQEYARRLS